MIRTLTTLAAVAILSTFAGCNNNKTTAPGGVAETAECCSDSGECCASTAPGAVGSDSDCASSCDKMSAAPGAVSTDSGCASSCSDKMSTAPGAVGASGGCPFSG